MEIRRNLPALFLRAVREFPREDMFLSRQKGGVWEKMSSREALRAVHEIAGGLLADGLEPGDRVGLISENRAEWALSDLAVQFCRCADVPVYPTLPADQVQYILEDAGARFAIVSTKAQATKIAKVRDKLPLLERVYSMDETLEGIEPLEAMRKRGRAYLDENPGVLEELLASIDPEEVATLIYTSGTTGKPKGVMLSHRNFCFNVATAGSIFEFEKGDMALSFLPLSHVLERMVSYTFMDKGLGIAHVRRIERVADALGEVKPHVFVTVPRLLEKAYAGVMGQVESRGGAAKVVASQALRWADKAADELIAGNKLKGLRSLRWKLADKAVLSKVRDRLGGRLKFVISGGAAMPAHVGRFFWSAGLPVYEGYGLTETSPVIAVNRPGMTRLGTVGPAIPDVEVRITEDGEVVTKGPHVMKGYWGRKEDTEEVLRGDWLYTGDLGKLDEDGYLAITGRKKEIIVLSTGKNLGPRHIESIIEKNKFVARVVAVGDEKPSVGLLILPDFDRLASWARLEDVGFEEPTELVDRPVVRKLFEQEIHALQAHLADHEKAKKFEFLREDLSEENGMLTPTQKVRRRQVAETYADLIDGMYKRSPR